MDAVAVDRFLGAAVDWFASAQGVIAVGLVGSWARGAATPESDVDLIVVVEDVESWLAQKKWLAEFGVPLSASMESWGAVQSLRVRYADGMEVEFGFAAAQWLAVPVDSGTARVIRDGIRILHDPRGALAAAAAVVRGH